MRTKPLGLPWKAAAFGGITGTRPHGGHSRNIACGVKTAAKGDVMKLTNELAKLLSDGKSLGLAAV
jgi:hypothetical protein